MAKSGAMAKWILVPVLLLGLLGTASADVSDFAFFDGSNPVNSSAGAICGSKSAFTYHLSVQNAGADDGFVRITYIDGDWIQFPVAAGQSFSMSQAAGNKSGDSAAIRVSNGVSAAQLAGSLSAIGQGNPQCASCDAVAQGGIGDAACDAFIPD
jgi:hypothetical protein